jgi:hypothetical protein
MYVCTCIISETFSIQKMVWAHNLSLPPESGRMSEDPMISSSHTSPGVAKKSPGFQL